MTRIGYERNRAIINGERPRMPPSSSKYSTSLRLCIERGWHPIPEERPSASEFLHQFLTELYPWYGEDETAEPSSSAALINVLQSEGIPDFPPMFEEEEKEKEKEKEEGREKENVKRIALTMKERCESVEEISVVEVHEAEECGSITCLAAARKIFANPISSSASSPSILGRFFSPKEKKIENFIVVGGTSRGWLLFWNDKVR
jgi:hypothetical protein